MNLEMKGITTNMIKNESVWLYAERQHCLLWLGEYLGEEGEGHQLTLSAQPDQRDVGHWLSSGLPSTKVIRDWHLLDELLCGLVLHSFGSTVSIISDSMIYELEDKIGWYPVELLWRSLPSRSRALFEVDDLISEIQIERIESGYKYGLQSLKTRYLNYGLDPVHVGLRAIDLERYLYMGSVTYHADTKSYRFENDKKVDSGAVPMSARLLWLFFCACGVGVYELSELDIGSEYIELFMKGTVDIEKKYHLHTGLVHK